MRPNRLIFAFALVLPALSACGGAQALDPATAETLQQQVRELATLTQEGNLDGALNQADALKAEVQAAEESGAVTPGRALRIQDNIDAFIASIQTEAPAPVPAPAPAPSTVPPAEPAPVPTFTAPAKGGEEDSRDPGETQSDREREAEEKAAEEAQKQAEKEEKERQKQEEDREDD